MVDVRADEQNTLDNKLVDKILPLLRIPYEDRTQDQHDLASEFLKNIEFFATKLNEDVKPEIFLRKCAVLLNLEFIPPGQAVYHFGEASNKIYILLKGRVLRYTQRTMDELILPSVNISRAPSIEEKENESPEEHLTTQDNTSRHRASLRPDTNMNFTKMSSFVYKSNFSKDASSPIQCSDEFIPDKSFTMKVAHTSQKNSKFSKARLSMSDLKKSVPQTPSETPEQSPAFNLHLLSNYHSTDNVVRNRSSIRRGLESKNASPQSKVQSLDNSINTSIESEITDINIPEDFKNMSAKALAKKYKNYEFNEQAVFEGFQEYKNKYFISGAFRFKHVRTYYPGEYFGEVGVAFDSQRVASLITASGCYLLSINKEDFEKAFAEEVEYTRDKIQFFQRLFADLPLKKVSDFASYFRRKAVCHNNVIYQQDDDVNAIYFIKDGDVHLSKMVTFNQGPDLGDKVTPRGITSSVQRKMKVGTLSENQSFGEEDLFKIKKRAFTVTAASSRCVIFEMTNRNLAKLSRLYPEIVESIKAESRARNEWHTKRINFLSQKTPAEELMRREGHINEEKTEIINIINQIKTRKTNQVKATNNIRRLNASSSVEALPRVSSKDITLKTEMSADEERYLSKLADAKTKMMRSMMSCKAHTANKYVDLPDIDPRALWQASLGNVGQSHVKLHSKKNSQDGLVTPSTDASILPPENKISHPSLVNLNKKINQILQTRPPQPQDFSILKSINSINIDSSTMMLDPLENKVEVSAFSTAYPRNRSLDSKNPMCVWSLAGNEYNRSRKASQDHKRGSVISSLEQTQVITNPLDVLYGLDKVAERISTIASCTSHRSEKIIKPKRPKESKTFRKSSRPNITLDSKTVNSSDLALATEPEPHKQHIFPSLINNNFATTLSNSYPLLSKTKESSKRAHYFYRKHYLPPGNSKTNNSEIS